MPINSETKARLEAQLADLEERRKRTVRELAQPLSRDADEQAVELEDDASLGAQAALIDREIASVKRALLRIESGTYGECVRCGDTIDPKRLEARPEAALCFSCASQEQ
ncbi:MAG: TraR/DksA family transcriptional regulator [Sphingomonadaceae bacterium]